MNPGHAATSGALTGLLFGCAICLIQNIPVVDSLFRIFVLTFAGAWMGILLSWLNQIIPAKMDQDSPRQKNHSDSGL